MRGTVPPTAGARSTRNTWWQALGHAHHARALVVCQAVFLFDAAPVAEVYHLFYGVCTPQAVIEVLEALVEEGQLARSRPQQARSGARECRLERRMAVSVMWRWLVVAGAEAQPTVTVMMRLAEAEWHAGR